MSKLHACDLDILVRKEEMRHMSDKITADPKT